MTKKKTRLAGAQLPIGIDIQWNKKEILKAIDWALENEVDHLLTPEGSLSGYGYRWMDKLEEIQDAIKEIEQKIDGKNGPVGDPKQIGFVPNNVFNAPCGATAGGAFVYITVIKFFLTACSA